MALQVTFYVMQYRVHYDIWRHCTN